MHPLDALMNLINPPGGAQPGSAATGPGPGPMYWLDQFHNMLGRASGGWLGSQIPLYDNKAANAAPGYSWQDIAAKAAADAAKVHPKGK